MVTQKEEVDGKDIWETWEGQWLFGVKLEWIDAIHVVYKLRCKYLWMIQRNFRFISCMRKKDYKPGWKNFGSISRKFPKQINTISWEVSMNFEGCYKPIIFFLLKTIFEISLQFI